MLTAGPRGRGAAGPGSKMASQQETVFCVLRFEVSRSVIAVQREFRARFRKDAPARSPTECCSTGDAAASSVHYTTSCKHILELLRMGEIIARNMLSWLKLLIKLLLLHLVGCLYYRINDARSHKHYKKNPSTTVFRCVCKISKSNRWLRHVCPHVATRLPLDRFSWNFIF